MKLAIQAVVLVFIGHQAALACLWDTDTLQMERREFPGAHEVVVGLFLQHSDGYYEWRIEDRLSKEEAERTPADYNDIGVAFDKLGHHQKAIDTIIEKLARWPTEDLYASEANLGTFYVHSGQLEKGLEHIRRAIELNPDAHFGREQYQQLLVEYVLAHRLADANRDLPTTASVGFDVFVLDELQLQQRSDDEKLKEALQGLLGMMRFGDHRSPVLLAAIGDILSAPGQVNDAKMLSARAYLLAARYSRTVKKKDHYRQRAIAAMEMQRDLGVDEIEMSLELELQQADTLEQEIAADERAWIRDGEDLDTRFQLEYYESPTMKLRQVEMGRHGPLVALLDGQLRQVGIALFAMALLTGFFVFKPSFTRSPATDA